MPPERTGSSGRSRPAGRAPAPGEETVRRGTEAVRARAAEAVAGVTHTLREKGEKLIQERKHRAARELREVGRSIRGVAGQLRDGPLGPVGDYVEAAAKGVTRASRYLDEQDLGTLVKDAEAVVRQVPQWFLPGMFLAGLALARFAKATENGPGQSRRRSGRRRASR